MRRAPVPQTRKVSRSLARGVSICLLLLTLFSFGCSSGSTSPTPSNPGQLISGDLIKTFEKADFEKVRTVELDDFLRSATMSAADFRSELASTYKNVSLYRVAYASQTPELDNQKVIAYGLVAVPEGANDGTPVVSYQHGTVFTKEEAPSNPEKSMETKLALLQFASQGYIVVAADYFGNGPLSTVPNSPFVRASSEQAMFDMHKASMAFLAKMNITPGKLFLLGWSQGGYNTLLHFRTLERNNIPVAGVATASGPGDPASALLRTMFARRSFDVPYPAPSTTNIIFAYENYHRLPGSSRLFIQPGKYDIAKDFYEFKKTFLDYLGAGGGQLDNVCSAEFFSTARTTSHPFWVLLSQAESYRWLSQAPPRQYYSNRDEAVPADLGKLAVDYQTALGKTNASSHDAGSNADHRSVYLYALIHAKPWFDSLR